MNEENYFDNLNNMPENKLVLSGDLKIQQLDFFLDELKNNLDNGENKTLDILIRDVTSIDMTFIQLIYAYIKTAKLLHKEVKINWQISSEYEDLIAKCGFIELLN